MRSEKLEAANEIGLLGEGLVTRAGRRTPCARESCNSDSSPEPAAACSEGDLYGERRVGARNSRGLVGRGGFWGGGKVRGGVD